MQDLVLITCPSPKYRRVTEVSNPLAEHPTVNVLIVCNPKGYRVRVYADELSMLKTVFRQLPHPATPRDESVAWVVKELKSSEHTPPWIEVHDGRSFIKELGDTAREELYTAIAQELLTDAFFRF